ncbi:hypothetical protein DK26_25620 [Bosea sp. WAO]|uniref:hypothetical protein n=1 Tax=Bosea sp. WAO TaxID=406341 RepID=UPI000747B16C|nr:hypothetical protein [Bosea sp. WAO]KUL93108.1 hypothetical protein DK26_25620 [Bosea sp. WAO]
MHLSVAPVAIIWDGSRHVAAIWSENARARFLAAEETGGRITLIAAGDGDDAPLSGKLPPGSRVLHAVTVPTEGESRIVSIQLDERLTPDEANPLGTGLALLRAHSDGAAGTLAIERHSLAERPQDTPETLIASGLNQVAETGAGTLRLLAGPFMHPADERATLTRVSASRDDGLTLEFRGEGSGAGILVAHFPAAMRQARQTLAQLDQDLRLAVEEELDSLGATPADLRDSDATGLGRVAALRRGFRLLRPVANADGSCRVSLADWLEEDEILVFAEPRRLLVWTGAGDAANGAPMTIRWQDGEFGAVSHRESYAASVSTGLTLGGGPGQALVVATPGTAAPLRDDLALAAGRLADGLWQATPARTARLSLILAEIAVARAQAPADAGPFARIDARAKTPEAGSNLLEAAAALTGLDPSRADELGERALGEQTAMLLWAVEQPKVAARACAARLLLPAPGAKTPPAETERLLGWYEDPALPHLLGREAMTLAGQDRRAMRLLHDIAACAHQSWLDADVVAEVEQTIAEARKRRGQRPLSNLDGLLLALRRTAQRRPPSAPALEEVARRRSELVEAGAQSGQSQGLLAELTKRLGELTPGEIILLHEHFAGLRRAAAQSAAAGELILSWEKAAGLAGLAARNDRSGDALRGASRLAATTEGFVATIDAIEGLAPALGTIEAQIGQVLGEEDAAAPHALGLRRILGGYARLLLADLALREADTALASTPFAAKALADTGDPGFGAAYRRLRAGASDTLARYLAAAVAVSGIDHEWGGALRRATAYETVPAETGRENG